MVSENLSFVNSLEEPCPHAGSNPGNPARPRGAARSTERVVLGNREAQTREGERHGAESAIAVVMVKNRYPVTITDLGIPCDEQNLDARRCRNHPNSSRRPGPR